MKHATLILRRLAAATLMLLILSTLLVPAFAETPEDGQFNFTVVGLQETEDGLEIALEYDNRTGSRLSFGWVNSCSVVVKTNKGTYSDVISFSGDINIGNGSCMLFVPNCFGEVETIKLTEITLLKDSGLPDADISDVIIYENGETGQVYEFSFFSKIAKYLPFILIFGVVICIFAVVASVVHKQHKKASEAFKTFTQAQQQPDVYSTGENNGFAPPPGMNDAPQQPSQQNESNGGFTPPPQM
ncbi:MAG: hypothetical protein IJC46_02000 [Clostridia bacterium]|nr:hypothetical protein [Clostridia bacterium]